MEDVRKLVEEVLEKGFFMNLGTIDQTGPWVSTVIFVHDTELNLYWVSFPTRRHSVAIEHDFRAAATITLAHARDDEKVGLQVQGRAERLDAVDASVVEAYAKRFGKPSINGQHFAPNQSWYVLHPTKIDLIHQPLFGYEKKYLEL